MGTCHRTAPLPPRAHEARPFSPSRPLSGRPYMSPTRDDPTHFCLHAPVVLLCRGTPHTQSTCGNSTARAAAHGSAAKRAGTCSRVNVQRAVNKSIFGLARLIARCRRPSKRSGGLIVLVYPTVVLFSLDHAGTPIHHAAIATLLAAINAMAL